MIIRGRRLPRASFGALVRAKRLTSQHFVVSLAPVARGGVAVVVPKKVAAHSVDRHLLKRRVLSVLAPWARPHTALVVHAKTGSPALPFAALKRELEGLLGKLHLPT
jgi:ribonuclease P protein component